MGSTLAGWFVAGCGPTPPDATAELWPEADRLFHAEPRWIGGDGAYSVDLEDGRIFWAFGDSYIASDASRTRARSRFIRNSVAIQVGSDPSLSAMRFYWQRGADGAESFFPEDDGRWFWPMHGAKVDGRLILFWERLRQNGPPGPDAFETDGWTAAIVNDPSGAPSEWDLDPVELPAEAHGVSWGEAVLVEDRFVYVYGTRGIAHETFLARFEREAFGQGDLQRPAFWTGDAFEVGAEPEAVISPHAPEYSVYLAPELGRYVAVESLGYGPTTIALRAAERPEGPWSEPRTVLRPPESFERDAFVYAAKGHPELHGADLVVTYVPSSFRTPPVELEAVLYYPRFVRLSY